MRQQCPKGQSQKFLCIFSVLSLMIRNYLRLPPAEDVWTFRVHPLKNSCGKPFYCKELAPTIPNDVCLQAHGNFTSPMFSSNLIYFFRNGCLHFFRIICVKKNCFNNSVYNIKTEQHISNRWSMFSMHNTVPNVDNDF